MPFLLMKFANLINLFGKQFECTCHFVAFKQRSVEYTRSMFALNLVYQQNHERSEKTVCFSG